ncbi:MAG: CapA family protein [Gammaproteobacteria bacterium]
MVGPAAAPSRLSGRSARIGSRSARSLRELSIKQSSRGWIATAPDAIPRIQPLLRGDVVFTNFEGAIAQQGQSVTGGGRGFLAPAEALDPLQALGFNLLSLSNNHAFDLKEAGIDDTLREVERRGIAHAGIGATLAQAASPTCLRVGNMTVALVASASGLIAPGGGGARAASRFARSRCVRSQ